MDPKKSGGKASSAATSSSSPKNSVGHSSECSGFGNIPKVDQLIRDVAGLTSPKKNNKNQGEASSPKQWGTRINEELCETVCDREIVWPPMVIVKYHLKVDNEKCIRRGNLVFGGLESLDAILARHGVGPGIQLPYFTGYNAVEARHAFGHISTILLKFENSAIGYVEAERLHKHFADQGTGKDAWDHCRLLDETRHQFYGYMANKEDIDIFNQHSGGKKKVNFEMRSLHEMVVIPMDGVNQRLFWLYSRAVKGEKDAKACQDFNGKLAEKLRETMVENHILGKRTKLQHGQNKAEFFKDQINHIHQASEEERAFEELLPEERKKMKKSIVDTIANEDLSILSLSELYKVIQTQAKNIKELEAERENLIQILQGRSPFEMDPKKLGGKASSAATSSSSPKNSVGHSSECSGFGNIPKVDQLIRDVAGLKPPYDIDWAEFSKNNKYPGLTSPWAVFSKNNKYQGETSPPKQWGTRINEELCETVCDREIVWPPMVMVRYHEKDDNEKVFKDDIEKWIHRGNLKLPDYDDAILARHSVGPHGLPHHFSVYNAVEARHSFGHRGISLLIFENSVMGYLEAEQLHQHFTYQGKGKDAWDQCKLLDGTHHRGTGKDAWDQFKLRDGTHLRGTGKVAWDQCMLRDGTHLRGTGKVAWDQCKLLDWTHHQFYGYMANKEDVDIFNQHCRDEMKVKFEMRSHYEMVVVPMDGVDQRVFWLYSRAVKGEKDAKTRQDFYCKAAEKLCETMEENRIVRKRTKLQQEHNKPEFFKDEINHIHQALEEERAFEELLPEEGKKMKQSIVDTNQCQ